MMIKDQTGLSMPIAAAIQMCSSNTLIDNLEMASRLIAEAAMHKSQLVVLPEMFAMIGTDSSAKLAIQEPYGEGIIQSFLHEQSKKHKIWIVAGTIPISYPNNSKIRAASLVYDDKGQVVARYDKIHLFDVTISATEKYLESETTDPGDEVVVIDTPIGKLGLAVCFDIRFTSFLKKLYEKGAEIIALPSAFTMKTGEAHWELLVRACAVQHFSYVIGAAQGGVHASSRQTYGHSLIVEPWGSIVAAKATIEPGVIHSEIDLAHLHSVRKLIPLVTHPE